MIRLALFAAAALFLIGVGWKTVAYFEANYISTSLHERRVTEAVNMIVETVNNATEEKRREADEIEREVDAVSFDVPADIRRLCNKSASCRDRAK